jgi:hypothetical protein
MPTGAAGGGSAATMGTGGAGAGIVAGSAGSALGGTGGTGVVACGDGLTNRRLRRLSRREYANVVSDLLGAKYQANVLAAWPFEANLAGFDNQDSNLFVSDSLHEKISDLAAELAAAITPADVAPCSTSGGSAACLQSFITSFASKAFGRTLTSEELARVNTVAAMGQDYATSVRLVVELVLQSPHFLYVSELGAADASATPGQAVPLTPDEVASQLSFMLLGARPDAALLSAVASNTLSSKADVMREAERLLKTSRASVELSRFIKGWLAMEPVADAPKSPTTFAALTPAITAAMQQELDAFITAQLEAGQGTFSAFFTAPSANIPAALGPVYGADLVNGVPNPAHRAGVLTLPGFLTYHASYAHSGPIERGLFIRRQLLCQQVPPPPDSVLMRIAANPINPDDTTKTTRQKYEAHVNEASCSGCHSRFDPIGYGFEEMDGIGRYRTEENGQTVDTSGELTLSDVDGKFSGVVELSTKLARSKMVQDCAVSHFFRFAQSRPAETNDACVVQDWSARLAAAGGRIGELVMAQVSHPNFANRKDDR